MDKKYKDLCKKIVGENNELPFVFCVKTILGNKRLFNMKKNHIEIIHCLHQELNEKFDKLIKEYKKKNNGQEFSLLNLKETEEESKNSFVDWVHYYSHQKNPGIKITMYHVRNNAILMGCLKGQDYSLKNIEEFINLFYKNGIILKEAQEVFPAFSDSIKVIYERNQLEQKMKKDLNKLPNSELVYKKPKIL